MDSSNYSCNYNNTILSFHENDINNSTPKLDDPCSYSLFNFPNSPQYSNMEYESLCLHQIYHHLLSDQQNTENPPEENPTKLVPKSIRSSKKDRHSKINTARGPRDRRMRLSLDVARKFFDLQDMLGYDKASRTVDWLLKNSSLAISDLERGRIMGANYVSTTNSESCEQVVSSGIDNLSGVWENGKNEERSSAKQMKKKVKKERKVLARPIVEKESRKKARERARVRASQKRRLLSNDQQKTCGEKSDNQYERLMVVKSRERDEIFDESMSFEMSWNYSSSIALNSHEDGISQSHYLGEFQFCGKPWEAQNSCN